MTEVEMTALPPEGFQSFEQKTKCFSPYIVSISAPAWSAFRTSVGSYLSDSFIQRARVTRAWAIVSGAEDARAVKLPLPSTCGSPDRQRGRRIEVHALTPEERGAVRPQPLSTSRSLKTNTAQPYAELATLRCTRFANDQPS